MLIELQNVVVIKNSDTIKTFVKLNGRVLRMSLYSACTYLNKENKDKLNKFLGGD